MALAAYRETLQRIDKTSKIASVVSVLEGLTHKYTFEPEAIMLANKNPSLTIKDMWGKAEILDELRSDLLPSIKYHLSSLLSSLDLIDPKQKPQPDIDSTVEILSSLDKILESTVSSAVSLLESPLPDENHDHGLGNLKVFRCYHLRNKVKDLVADIIYEDLFGSIKSFIQWCTVTYIFVENPRILSEGSELRDVIHIITGSAQDSIDVTINWGRKSDWAVVREAWLEGSESLDETLEMLTSRNDHSIQEHSQVEHHERPTAKVELIAEVAKSAIPLVKLGRILVKKTSETISKKHLSALGTHELNSETMSQLHKAPEAITEPLEHLCKLLNILYRSPRLIRIADQHRIRKSVDNLSKDMESTLAVLDACLFPFLRRLDDDSPDLHPLQSFFSTLKVSWDKASDRLMDVILSFEVERIAI